MTATTEDKSDDLKDSFYKELEKVFNQSPNYRTNILLWSFNAKLKKNILNEIFGVFLYINIEKSFIVKNSKICHIKI
jgi:hypothetical protein